MGFLRIPPKCRTHKKCTMPLIYYHQPPPIPLLSSTLNTQKSMVLLHSWLLIITVQITKSTCLQGRISAMVRLLFQSTIVLWKNSSLIWLKCSVAKPKSVSMRILSPKRSMLLF
ncbi:uncharacterized protein DS421_10g301370 [Arachis hypogaea]|nr:uncharacterized protein DS421_10g301370 [Arachis hypogaea]